MQEDLSKRTYVGDKDLVGDKVNQQCCLARGRFRYKGDLERQNRERRSYEQDTTPT